jgi:HD domain
MLPAAVVHDGVKNSLRRWWPEGARRPRAQLAIAVNLGGVAAMAAAFVAVSPAAHWEQPELLAALGAIAIVAYAAEINLKLPPTAYFDASLVVALLALAIAGPLPALLVWLLPDAISRWVMRQNFMFSPGLLANATSFGFAVLAGASIVGLAEPASTVAAAFALFCAGLAMWAINFLFARLLFAPFYQGFRARVLIRSEFIDLAPLALGMLLIGTVTWLLVPPVGIFALALLAAAVVVPQLGMSTLARSRSVSRLTTAEASALYSAAIADALRLSRRERRLVALASDLCERASPSMGPVARLRLRSDLDEAAFIARHANERWDGRGRPEGLHEGEIPLLSRVVAVARAWARLTASGTVQVTHAEAMLGLAAQAGTALDPVAVWGAQRVVTDEQTFIRSPDAEPRLHSLPFPRPVRRGAIPALATRLVGVDLEAPG